MKDWIEAQASTGRYSDASDYVGDLIRRDQEWTGKLGELQKLITEGMESGVSVRSTDDLLQAAREQAASIAQDHAILGQPGKPMKILSVFTFGAAGTLGEPRSSRIADAAYRDGL